jgi:hypothetical protein
VDDVPQKAAVCRGGHPLEFALDNGLARRVFRISPNAATVSKVSGSTAKEPMVCERPRWDSCAEMAPTLSRACEVDED